MWFDAQAALAEIGAVETPEIRPDPGATRATCATPPLSDLSRVAHVAHVARPPAQKTETVLDFDTDRFPHALSALGNPITWTGRLVSRDDWQRLTDWERHGPDGRVWNGKTKAWEQIT